VMRLVSVMALVVGYFGFWLKASIDNARNNVGVVPSICERDIIGILHCGQCLEC